jgi:ethanolamine utilization microcompartment shell protein EutS
MSFRQPTDELFLQPGLYVTETSKNMAEDLRLRFADVRLIGFADRFRGGEVIRRYAIYRVAAPFSHVLDPAQ